MLGVRALLLLLLTVVFGVLGCRGWTSDKPPVHLNPNMDTQPKYKAYRESDFFKDKRSMRPLEAGVVARGFLKEDDHFYRGKKDGKLATAFPDQIEVNKGFVKRGQERFGIYCAPCHSESGAGDGLVGKRMVVRPTTFHTDYMHNQPVGHFFDVITNGIRTMSGYRYQISEEDRWAVVAYIRSLQISQDAEGEWQWKQ